MVISGVLFETASGKVKSVAERLAHVKGIEITGSDGDHKLAVVWRGKHGAGLLRAADLLLKSDPDIVGIFPTFVGKE
jgi:nitrate reductase NapAB chaperone NapD